MCPTASTGWLLNGARRPFPSFACTRPGSAGWSSCSSATCTGWWSARTKHSRSGWTTGGSSADWPFLSSARSAGPRCCWAASARFRDEPLNLDNAPLNLDNAPLNLDNAPLNLDNGPLNLDNAPLNLDKTPLTLETDPRNFDTTPLTLDDAPLALQPAPPCFGSPPRHSRSHARAAVHP